jgi:hypothetical protein
MMMQMVDPSTVDPTNIAIVYAALGDYDVAFEWLEKAFQNRYRVILWIKSIPEFDPMRNDPRFADLLRRMNLPL